ncbi:MAG: adenylate/guanylate cyclase domain-containing protein [Flavobacteriaceae bacterium]
MALHPKYRRYFWQAFSFAVIWTIFGLVYVIVEKGLLGNSTLYPATNNKYDFKSSIIYTPIVSFLMGFIQGWVEVAWMKKKFLNKPFWLKIVFKGAIYLIMIIIFLGVLTLLVNSFGYGLYPWDPEIVDTLIQFFTNFSFWSIVIYAGVVLDVALFFSEVRDYLGSGIFYNYSFGTYFKPKKEIRIFMFLDMKSSTSIAEKLGHEKYFNLIKAYYADMTDAILETSGEIYQYVGDEIVVSWPENKGLLQNNCIQCFIKINRSIKSRESFYKTVFGFVPEFKAGLHLGEVTTGEIGTLKKEIIYTGDVLNTAARIQSLCNQYNARLLISEMLKNRLVQGKHFRISEIGKITLRGRLTPLALFKVEL